jgi:hypothetical protein
MLSQPEKKKKKIPLRKYFLFTFAEMLILLKTKRKFSTQLLYNLDREQKLDEKYTQFLTVIFFKRFNTKKQPKFHNLRICNFV